MKTIAAVMLTLPLLLSACGDSADDNGTSASTGSPTGSREILEGTIDDSMIDLTGIDTQMVPDESGAAEGTDQPEADNQPAANSASEGESDTPADGNDEAESESENAE